MWNPDEFLERLYSGSARIHSFQAATRSEWSAWRTALTEAVTQAVALPPDNGTGLEPVQLELVDCGDYVRERIQLRTDDYLQMTCYVLVPKTGMRPYPAVVACPGHGYGSKQLVGLLPDGNVRPETPGIYKDYPVELVKRGFLVIVPELLGLGDRRLLQDRDKDPKENSCFRLAANLLMAGKTLAGYRVREMMRCIDYLQSRPDTAPDRIGCMGFSGGALVMTLTAALDERIRAAVISGYTNMYMDSILAKPHCLDNYVPALLEYAEFPDIAALISPRPLLIEAGREDQGFPLEGALKAVQQIKPVYKLLDAEELLDTDIHSGKHEVSGEKAYDWLESHLKGSY